MGKLTKALPTIGPIQPNSEVAWVMAGFGFGCLFLPHELFRQLQAFRILPDQVWGMLFLLIGLLGFVGIYKRQVKLLIGVYLCSSFLLATVAWSLISQGAFATMTTYLIIALFAAQKGAQLLRL